MPLLDDDDQRVRTAAAKAICRLLGWDDQQTVVREIGHQVLGSGKHTDDTIMDSEAPVASEYEKFSDADIAAIRAKISSPGTE